MKYLKPITALLILALVLTACGSGRPPAEDEVDFYYLRAQIGYGTEQSVIAPERRQIENHTGDIQFLLRLYIQGPATSDFVSPFPEGIELISLNDSGSCLEIVLNERLSTLTGMELTLACSCIAKTCFGISDATEVRVSAEDSLLDGASYISITADSLLLTDDSGN